MNDVDIWPTHQKSNCHVCLASTLPSTSNS